MKECYSEITKLEEIGEMLDDFEKLFCVDLSKGQIINKKGLKWELLKRLLPELAIFLGKPEDVITQAINSIVDYPEMDIIVWQKALLKITSNFTPIFSKPLIYKKIIKS